MTVLSHVSYEDEENELFFFKTRQEAMDAMERQIDDTVTEYSDAVDSVVMGETSGYVSYDSAFPDIWKIEEVPEK